MSDDELATLVLDETRDRMDKAVDHTRGEFAAVRSGRATAALVEHLRVDIYGSEVELRTVAGLSVPEPRMLVISPYDKSTVPAIEKAIRTSDLGINPSNDGTVIRLTFPPLTEERRRELVKVVRHKAEEGRVAVRNLRRTARHELEGFEHDGAISADELERQERELDKLTHDMVTAVDKLLAHKEQELLEI
ncbi:MAG: ribosome recycling factor [Actinomycetota bacterium]|jgi:ribosome recycling factor|nr:ribosome recycling factor [Actinomycetota bacterium]MDA8281594.1 ribosome recycling factor [Actinomycetota bacterium]